MKNVITITIIGNTTLNQATLMQGNTDTNSFTQTGRSPITGTTPGCNNPIE